MCKKVNFREKLRIQLRSPYFTGKPTEPKGGVGVAARGDHAILGRGQGWAHAQVWRGHLGNPPTLPFGLHKALDLNIIGGFVIFRETHPRSTANTISILGIRSSVLAPCRDGEVPPEPSSSPPEPSSSPPEPSSSPSPSPMMRRE